MQSPAKYLKKSKLIKRRTIRHGQIGKASKNKNCPKFILGYCWHLFRQQILSLSLPQEQSILESSFQVTQEWVENGNRDHFSLANLVHLFGTASNSQVEVRNYVNSKVFFKFLSLRALDLVVGNRKIEKPVSYLVCLQKLTARLANAELANKIQFK